MPARCKVLGMHFNVTKEVDVQGMIQKATEFGGRIDFLFNNAGASGCPVGGTVCAYYSRRVARNERLVLGDENDVSGAKKCFNPDSAAAMDNLPAECRPQATRRRMDRMIRK
jgi:NAD(P)-dependent dehydrogenase (short-subunit alcohol dehydrogenase family)